MLAVNDTATVCEFHQSQSLTFSVLKVKVRYKGRALCYSAPYFSRHCHRRYMARTKQRRTYLPYTFPAVAGTHLPTPRGWRVE